MSQIRDLVETYHLYLLRFTSSLSGARMPAIPLTIALVAVTSLFSSSLSPPRHSAVPLVLTLLSANRNPLSTEENGTQWGCSEVPFSSEEISSYRTRALPQR